MRRNAEREKSFATSSGVELEPTYTPEDIAEIDYNEEIGYPGEYPFTRGVQPTMYRGRLWSMRQYAGFASAEESNRRFRFLLQQGQNGLSVAFDLPTQCGYDSDAVMATGEVGQVGVPIDSLRDMETLFNQIPLTGVSTSMTINSTASVLLGFYLALGRRQGADWNALDGTIQNDVLKEYIARGTYIYPPAESMRIITDIFAFCSKSVKRWNTISISGYHMREAGCTAAQEVGFTLANGIAYVESAIKAGMDVDDFAGRLSFFFVSYNNFLEEVAKMRAARRLWARIMKERFKAKNERSMMMRFHTQTGGSTLTAQQPLNNIVRTTIQALAGVLGGTQSLHTNSWDEALSLPTEQAVQVALRTQQIIGYESGVGDTIDPLAGSYQLEYLTNKIEAEARAYIDKIDELGGSVRAIEQGYIQREIMDASFKYIRDVEIQNRTIVGVNKFQTKEPVKNEIFRVDPSWAERQRESLAEVRRTRDSRFVAQALHDLEVAAKGDTNLMPLIVEAVAGYATLGEVCDTLRGVYGEAKEVLVI
ncbi:MAG: methylmalonyl-CoA mutase family protein [Chloroflexi bacterium]|nr:methylmalonyl-CoA mutase family protein [Chloroflexota bacterium]